MPVPMGIFTGKNNIVNFYVFIMSSRKVEGVFFFEAGKLTCAELDTVLAVLLFVTEVVILK